MQINGPTVTETKVAPAGHGHAHYSLADNLACKGAQPADINLLAMILHAMRLPMPEDGEFIKTRNALMTFLTRTGLVLKILEQCEYEKITLTGGHGLVLQPLKMIPLSAGNGAIALLPGTKPMSENQRKKLDRVDQFLRDNTKYEPFGVWDIVEGNIGFLPMAGNNEGVPVLIDHGSVARKDGWKETPLTGKFRQAYWYDHQNRILKDVKTRLAAAWPQGTQTPDLEKMKEFMDYCASIVSLNRADPARVLAPGWAETPDLCKKGRSAGEAAARYQARLRAA